MSTTIPYSEATLKVEHLGLEVRVDVRIISFRLVEKPLDVSKLPSLVKKFLDTLEPKDFE